MNLKQTLTPAKLAAHRRNARRSTGPRTLRGKRIAALNALKSGLFSRHVLIPAGDGKEDHSEFNRLLAGLNEHFQPEGMLESLLVDTIAACAWRSRRVLRYETGEIRRRLDSAISDQQDRLADEFSRQEQRVLQNFLHRTATGPQLAKDTKDTKDTEDTNHPLADYTEAARAMQRNSYGLQHLTDLLQEFRKHIEQNGSLDEDSEAFLALNFASDRDGFLSRMIKLCALVQEATPPAPEAEAAVLSAQGASPKECKPLYECEPPEAASPKHTTPYASPSLEDCKKLMLALIDREAKILNQRKQATERNEALAAEHNLEALNLPSDQASNTVLRYAASIDRQLYRALNQLERIQRQRRGEPVPPPVSLSVS